MDFNLIGKVLQILCHVTMYLGLYYIIYFEIYLKLVNVVDALQTEIEVKVIHFHDTL